MYMYTYTLKCNERVNTVSIRPYQYECTRNHQNSEVKRAWACLVLGWGTTREQQVLYAFLSLLFLRTCVCLFFAFTHALSTLLCSHMHTAHAHTVTPSLTACTCIHIHLNVMNE